MQWHGARACSELDKAWCAPMQHNCTSAVQVEALSVAQLPVLFWQVQRKLTSGTLWLT